jgi:hypothetical protein
MVFVFSNVMNQQAIALNIRYDAPDEVWKKIPFIYSQLNGWLGFGKGGNYGDTGIPYWFSYNENEKHILASVETSGLQFAGLMDDEEWGRWIKDIKDIATKELGYKIGEIETGEVDY